MINDLVLAGANPLQPNRQGDSILSFALARMLSMVFYGKVIKTRSGMAGAEANLAIMESFFAAGPVKAPVAEKAWILLYSDSFWTHSAPPRLTEMVSIKTGLSGMTTQEMMMMWILDGGLDLPGITPILDKKSPGLWLSESEWPSKRVSRQERAGPERALRL